MTDGSTDFYDEYCRLGNLVRLIVTIDITLFAESEHADHTVETEYKSVHEKIQSTCIDREFIV